MFVIQVGLPTDKRYGSSWVFAESARRALSTDGIDFRFGGLRGSSRLLKIHNIEY
jgi:hypothetical protein